LDIKARQEYLNVLSERNRPLSGVEGKFWLVFGCDFAQPA